ncbi:hypothetical protein [Streptomyces sp. NPDC004285]
MSGPWKYFEENPEIAAALVAAIAVVAGIVGAKIQANAGRAQAAAAREAAQIAAEAQRVAALWSVRQVQVAEFLEQIREVRRLGDLFYTQDSTDGALTSQFCEAERLMVRKEAEIEGRGELGRRGGRTHRTSACSAGAHD